MHDILDFLFALFHRSISLVKTRYRFLLIEMTDLLSISASVLVIAAAFIQSVICLCDAVKRFKSRDKTLKRLLGELQDFINILNQLEKVAIVHETSTLKLLEGSIG